MGCSLCFMETHTCYQIQKGYSWINILRYILSAFEKRYNELVREGYGFENDKDIYIEENVFYVSEEARWEQISSAAHTPKIGEIIEDAMRAIEKK